MKNIITTAAILLIAFHCFSQIKTDSSAIIEKPKSRLTISGTLFYTSISRGGIQRDERNLLLIPLQKFTLYVVRYISAECIPEVVKSFTSDKHGNFSVSLPPGKYGFVSSEEAENGLSKGQCLPKSNQTATNDNINSSEWECNMVCPIVLDSISIQNLVITNHLISSCMKCP